MLWVFKVEFIGTIRMYLVPGSRLSSSVEIPELDASARADTVGVVEPPLFRFPFQNEVFHL